MKRILSIILAVLMLVPLCIFNISAEGEEQSATCSIGQRNIANEASVGYIGTSFWGIDEGALVDGNRDKLAHSPKDNSFTYSLKFGSLKDVNKIALYVNGTGDCSRGEGEHSATPENCVKEVSIKLYDDTGRSVHEDSFDLYDDTDPENIIIGTEATFEFDTIAISTLEVYVKTGSYGSAYFREIEVYEEIGEHAWTLDEENSIASSCEDSGVNAYKCACGATKEEETNQHTVEEWETKKPATTLDSGIAHGPCVVPGCGGTGVKTLPRLSLTDNQKKLNLNHITVIEDVKDIRDYVDETHADYKNNVFQPNEERNPEALFDSVIDVDPHNPTNFWCGTAFGIKRVLVPDDPETPEDETQYEIVTPDDPETPDKNETVYAYDYYYSTLTIELDQVYSLTQAELFVYSNWNNFKIEFKGADGSTVKEINKNSYQNSTFTRMIFTGDIYGQDVKSIVITVTASKWAGGKGLAFTEMKLSAHECQFTDEEIANGTTENCVTTFSGTCSLCKVTRTDAKITSHTWEKDAEDDTKDKIVETLAEVTCFRNGKVTKHCTECNQDVMVVIDATGDHVFGDTLFDKENVTLKPTCGDNGLGYEKCTVEGCNAESDLHTVPPQGDHTFKWTEKVGMEADYTHEGVKGFICTVCGTIDESQGTQVSPMLDSKKLVSGKDWSLRYTDFVSPRATFKISIGTVNQIELSGFKVKIFGVVTNGEATKEIQIYGDGATGVMLKDGTFSLVVANSEYSNDYNFSARIEITCSEDNTMSNTTSPSKNISTAGDGLVSAKDVASYYLLPNKVNSISPELKTFYEQIVNN